VLAVMMSTLVVCGLRFESSRYVPVLPISSLIGATARRGEVLRLGRFPLPELRDHYRKRFSSLKLTSHRDLS
jgi:hypothetical protein